jgi:hypothetical protein
MCRLDAKRCSQALAEPFYECENSGFVKPRLSFLLENYGIHFTALYSNL